MNERQNMFWLKMEQSEWVKNENSEKIIWSTLAEEKLTANGPEKNGMWKGLTLPMNKTLK